MRAIPFKVWFVSLAIAVMGGAVRAEVPPVGEQKERAVAALEQSVKSDPGNPELWIHLGFAYRKMDRIDQALEAFEKASALDPKNQESLYMLGLIYEKMDRTQDALRVWKQYLSVATDQDRRGTAENHIHHLSQ